MSSRGEPHAEPEVEAVPGATSHPAIATVRAATQVLAESMDELALIRGICDLVVQRGGYRFAWAGFVAGEDAPALAHAGHEAGYLALADRLGDPRSRAAGPVATAVRTGHPQVVRSIADSESFQPWRDPALERGYRSCIVLPFGWGGEVYGALAIYSAKADAFDGQEAALLAELADKVSAGVYFLRLEQSHRQTEETLRSEMEIQEALRRILTLSLKPVSLEQKLEGVLDVLFSIPWFQVEHQGSIFLAEPDAPVLRLATRRHLPQELREQCASVSFGHCLCGTAAQMGETVFRAHVDGDHHTRFPGIEDHGHYCQPILAGDRVLGVLNLYVAPGHREREQEKGFLRAVADTVAGIIEREQADAERQRLATVLEASPDFVGIADIDGTPRYFNRTARTMLDCGEGGAPVTRCRIEAGFPDWANERISREGIPTALAKGAWRGETALCQPDGQPTPVSHLILAPREEDEEPTFIATICRDISDRKRAEEAAQALAVHEQRVANLVINSLPGIFFQCDGSGRLNRWNANLETQLGYDAARLRELNLQGLVRADDWPALEQALGAVADSEGVSVELEFVTAEGEACPFFLDITPVPELERLDAEVVGVGIDISERKAMEQELERRATRDFLTGLYNRHKFMEEFQPEWDRAERHGRPLSLLLLDIDHFKAINDTYGHDVGDRVLEAVVSKLQGNIRGSDVLARWGGEEFILLSPESRLHEACALAEKLRAALAAEPFESAGRVSASLGVAERRDEDTVESLLKRADDALYAAKRAGRNRVRTAE